MAGHEIEQEGYLEKSPPFARDILGRLKRWHPRYCVLSRLPNGETALTYYEDSKKFSNGGKHKGCILLQDCVEVRKVEGQLYNRDFLISLRTSQKSSHEGRVFLFRASNQVVQSHWFNAIERCMNTVSKAEAKEHEDDDVSRDAVQNFAPSRPTELEIRAYNEKQAARKRSSTTPNEITGEEILRSPDVCTTPNKDCDRRISNRSSGYETMDRTSSAASQCSEFSDIFLPGYQESKFDFSPTFEGPRVALKKPTMIKARSMGNLLDSVSINTRIEFSNAPTTSWVRRPSLQEQVDIILRKLSLEERTGASNSCNTSINERAESHESQHDLKKPRPSSEPCSSRCNFADFSGSWERPAVSAMPGSYKASASPMENDELQTNQRPLSYPSQAKARPSLGIGRQFSNIDETEGEQTEAAQEVTSINRTNSDPTSRKTDTKFSFFLEL
ncbi:uncharacterized protein LOC135685759 isoform X1 [Rhopilema esculentum]|uniref:uncharacterized protein LOC135685759 isoform X1 n=1 Tax=Rhopilema esculentum TaxID=499914 RepID=UPI0031D8DC50